MPAPATESFLMRGLQRGTPLRRQAKPGARPSLETVTVPPAAQCNARSASVRLCCRCCSNSWLCGSSLPARRRLRRPGLSP